MIKSKSLYAIVLFFWFFCFSVYAESDLKIHFIDVGKGDSFLIESPQGRFALIDAGSLLTAPKVVEYLYNHDIEKVDHLIFTHSHLDHIGGSFFLLPILKIRKIYDNGENLSAQGELGAVYRWYEQLVRKHKGYTVLKALDEFSLGDVKFKVIWPDKISQAVDNDNSLVIQLTYGDFRCLFAADISVNAEELILKDKHDVKANVLKVGHHGGVDVLSEDFLKAVSPQIAVISIDANNFNGYPDAGLIKRIQDGGVKLYRTDKDGNIVLSIGSKGEISVAKSKK